MKTILLRKAASQSHFIWMAGGKHFASDHRDTNIKIFSEILCLGTKATLSELVPVKSCFKELQMILTILTYMSAIQPGQ